MRAPVVRELRADVSASTKSRAHQRAVPAKKDMSLEHMHQIGNNVVDHLGNSRKPQVFDLPMRRVHHQMNRDAC